jgi:hypothetical protein
MIGVVVKNGAESDMGDYTVRMLCKDMDSAGKTASEYVNIIPLDLTKKYDNFYTAIDHGISSFNSNMLHISTPKNYALISQKRKKMKKQMN